MKAYDVRRLAAILAIQADVEAMKAENMQHEYLGLNMAYTYSDLHAMSENLTELATASNDFLHDLILSLGRRAK